MASLNMSGPFPLNEREIDQNIRKKIPGNYAYGFLNNDERFVVQYVGRSDDDLNSRIKHGIGRYKMFKYSYANDSKEAFEKECLNYHDFGGEEGILDNKIHPDRPKGTDYNCPVCDIFEGIDK